MVSMPALVKKLPQEGDIGAVEQSMKLSINPSLPGNNERMSVLHQDSGGIRKSIPSALEIFLGRGFCTPRPSGFPSGLGVQNPRPRKISRISLDPRDFPRASPSGNLLGLGKLGGGDGFPNTSLVKRWTWTVMINDIFLLLFRCLNINLRTSG